MKYALLVAIREYAENIKTKGFWIGLMLFPLILSGMIFIPAMLQQKATPTRHFTLVDQSAQFEDVILSALERSHQRRVLQALQQYAMTHARQAPGEGAGAPDLEQLPPPDRAAELLDEFAESNPEALDAFAREGGAQQVLERLRPLLRDDAPPFEEPRRRYQLVPLPAELDASSDLAVLGQELKPYLRGDRKIRLDGDAVTLYAAVLIPANLTNHIVRPARGMPDLQPGQGVHYWSVNLADLDLRNDVERAINEEIRRREYAGRGLDPDSIREIERTRAPFASLNPRNSRTSSFPPSNAPINDASFRPSSNTP